MYHFIVNPHSKSGYALKTWNKVRKVLEGKAVECEVHFTEYTKHAVELSNEICKSSGEKTIVIIGGDGTVNEVVNGLAYPCPDVTIGYIPTGSGNDLARGLAIARKPLRALDRILKMEDYAYTDIGILDMPDADEQRRFVVSSGIGYDSEVCNHILTSRLKKFLNTIKLGKISYLLIGLYHVLVHKPSDGVLTMDGGERIPFKKLLFIASMIQKSEGGGLRMTPDARNDDGLLSLCMVSNISKMRVFLTILFVFSGRHVNMKGIKVVNCREAEIETDTPFYIHTDGEINGRHRHVRLHCSRGLEGMVRFIR